MFEPFPDEPDLLRIDTFGGIYATVLGSRSAVDERLLSWGYDLVTESQTYRTYHYLPEPWRTTFRN